LPANGRDYVAIGKLMVEAGLLTREEVSIQTNRRTQEARPEDIQDWLDRNPRFVFFRENAGPGPVGAMGTVLTPLVSVATDPAHVAMGQPIWLNAAWPSDGAGKRAGDPLQILAVAEDKGGAIKGQGRIDLFWGAGELAEEMAGRMRVEGAYYPIVPRAWLLRTGRAPGS
jgi:membrane-bound lytic murein transglycosylase A